MHTEWTDLFSAYLDDELPEPDRRRIEAHLGGCAECRAVLADLGLVQSWARTYEGRAPDHDVWPAIRAGIERRRLVAFPRNFGWRHLIAASLAMVAVGAGATWLALRHPGPEAPAAADLPAPSRSGLIATSAGYDQAVQDLERVLQAGRGKLDSATVRVLEESLGTIDAAIGEARAAIQRDPANAYLNQRIASQMQQKLAILRLATRAIDAAT